MIWEITDLASNFTTQAAYGCEIVQVLEKLEYTYPEALLLAKLVNTEFGSVTEVVFGPRIEDTRGGFYAEV